MIRFIFQLFLYLSVMIISNNAIAAEKFVAGKDYLELTTTFDNKPSPNRIHVTEFFSYGCPACYHLEPILTQWLKKKPKYVVFKRIPVEFQPSWAIYARSYYVAEQLGALKKLHNALFTDIQQGNDDLSTETAMARFFHKYGIAEKEFTAAYQNSPDVEIKLKEGRRLMSAYMIYQVPTLVIDGKYKVDPSFTGGDSQRLFKVVNFLIKKESHAAHFTPRRSQAS